MPRGFRRKKRNPHGRHQALLETGRRAYCAVDLWELREELALTDCKLRGISPDADYADGLRKLHSRMTEITPEEGKKEGQSVNTSSLPNETATRLGRNRTKIHHFNEESETSVVVFITQAERAALTWLQPRCRAARTTS